MDNLNHRIKELRRQISLRKKHCLRVSRTISEAETDIEEDNDLHHDDEESRKASIKGLKTLKATGEGGTKLDFEEFKDKISNYFVQNKDNRADIAHLVTEREDAVMLPCLILTIFSN